MKVEASLVLFNKLSLQVENSECVATHRTFFLTFVNVINFIVCFYNQFYLLAHEEDIDEYNTMVVKEDDNDSEVSCASVSVLIFKQ